MLTMDKKIALELAALYSRRASIVNLIQALEEYASLPPDPVETPRPRGPEGRVPSHAA